MKIAIRHRLSLALGSGLARSAQHILLTPQTGPTQVVREWTIEMPGMASAASFIDGFGNRAQLVTQTRPEPELIISVAGVVDTIDKNGVIGRLPGEPPPALYRRLTPLTKTAGARTSKLRTAKDGEGRISLLHALMTLVGEVVPNGEQAQTQSEEGQAQSQARSRDGAADYAHAFIGAARGLGIPARFVTGYVHDGGQQNFHAWAEAWDDGLGWIAFDPMLGYCPTDRHIRVAVGLDAAGTAPVRAVPIAGTPQVLAMSVEAAQ